MKPADRSKLTSALRDHVARVAEDLRAQMRVAGAVRERALQVHLDERVGEDFELWTDLLARRGAVLWVLKSVYVRVLEDQGLLAPGRLLDVEAQQLFERLAPNLGETAFLRWVYRDLASACGGLPELFGPQPAEVAWPSDALSRELLGLWRYRDPDSGAQWSFAEETFEGELMGDLYQELDPVVKDRFALCQTPEFVRAFILDRTLTPAIEAYGAETVRLLDPSCGSGHFLIDGLKRLVAATAKTQPTWGRREVVERCLERVVGIDLNDYACALARARLVMTAAELAGVETLGEAARFRPHVYWADGLEQVERAAAAPEQQLDLLDSTRDEAPRASLTRADVRVALQSVFAPRFHAVVANPPYITEKDPARKVYHREKVGRGQRYVSAYRQYSLGAPFTERCFQLATPAGFVGLITSNNFMKREFGKPLIEQVLAGLDLTLVVDTSQAYIPFHGTPTVLLFGRNRPPQCERVRAVMGKRGESGTPEDPAQGKVWSSIEAGWDTVGFETEYVSVADLARGTLGQHPWSMGGGGAAELKERLEAESQSRLSVLVDSIGFMCITKQDDVFVQDPAVLHRRGLEPDWVRPFGMGDMVRDWGVMPGPSAVFPYDENIELRSVGDAPMAFGHLWLFRRVLEERAVFGGETFRTAGRAWWEYGQIPGDRFRVPYSIAFAFVATHNHFVLDRGGKVFNRSAPVIKLPPEASEDDHLTLLGLLNSSTACFWMKQVFHCKGSQGVNEGMKSGVWEQFFEFDATKMQLFPVLAARSRTLPYADALDRLARDRGAYDAQAVLADPAWTGARSLRDALAARRAADTQAFRQMVALQEELDWLCYALYGLDPGSDVVPADAVEPLDPIHLPWCLTLAARDLSLRKALARGETPEEQPTDWFTRHRWTPAKSPPDDLSAATRARIAARRARAAATPALALIETANFKRRWYRPDHAAEEKAALEDWLADRVEAIARDRSRPFTQDHVVAALQDDSRVLSVCEVLTGRPDFSLQVLVAERLQADAVPSHPAHVYKPSGLAKREVWERTWADQRREDAGEAVSPEVPPAYKSTDFLKTHYWRLRGKLDVPKERFVAFTEIPGRDSADPLYAWAGWTALQRLKALLSLDEQLEDGGVPLADRVGLLDSAWRLLPDVARQDPTAASRLKAEIQALVGAEGPSPEMLADWRARFPPPGNTRRHRR